MNLLHIRYFYDTVRLGSVSLAAKANFVTQSAVSQGIMKFERVLGAELLTHCRNRIKVTSRGEKVFHSCQQVMRSMTELESVMKAPEEGYHGQMVFACSHSMAQSVIQETLLELKKVAPAVTIKVHLGHTGIAKEWIKQGRVEFGLVLDNDDLAELDCEVIYSGAFKIFRSVSREESIPEECLFAEPRAEIFSMKSSFFDRYGRELKTQLEINSWEVIANLVEKDVGFGFFPDFLALNPRRRDLIVPCELDLSPIPYNLMIALPRGEKLSRNGQLFLEILRLN
ncbi:MAG: HTH-type transcriptional regulator HdfR [Chlamydiae bacterium]|nr:HTH-type transcriptional regulator HdfR [Chlamydiota bacterium]